MVRGPDTSLTMSLRFADRVYAVVREIPPGRVLGYGQVAALLGSPRAARQVGWALAALPSGTDVPWHRVLRSSGHIACEGSPHRAALQRALLEEEGVELEGDAVAAAAGPLRLSMARFGWRPGGPDGG